MERDLFGHPDFHPSSSLHAPTPPKSSLKLLRIGKNPRKGLGWVRGQGGKRGKISLHKQTSFCAHIPNFTLHWIPHRWLKIWKILRILDTVSQFGMILFLMWIIAQKECSIVPLGERMSHELYQYEFVCGIAFYLSFPLITFVQDVLFLLEYAVCSTLEVIAVILGGGVCNTISVLLSSPF